MKYLVATFTLLAFTGAAAVAQPVSSVDRHFLNSAMEGGVAEIALAHTVMQRTSDPTAHAFAQRMIRDHSKNDAQLAAVAQSFGIRPSHELPPEAADEQTKLQGLSGAAAAREYLTYEVKDHHKDIKDFSDELGATSQPTIRAYVQSSLPVLHTHLRLAERDAR
ncbi:MAG: DUF4142 domain-containing protein [Candidatus Eremiobacteraeota bacterium]|nr:DUF4142 domain-containing protein [Candidatus Eremiobacteraeota bacterium]